MSLAVSRHYLHPARHELSDINDSGTLTHAQIVTASVIPFKALWSVHFFRAISTDYFPDTQDIQLFVGQATSRFRFLHVLRVVGDQDLPRL